MGKGIKHWSKSVAILEEGGPLGIPLTKVVKETGRHLLGTLASAFPLPPPFLLGRKRHGSQESTEEGRTSGALRGACGSAFISQKQLSGVIMNTLDSGIGGDLHFFLDLMNQLTLGKSFHVSESTSSLKMNVTVSTSWCPYEDSWSS